MTVWGGYIMQSVSLDVECAVMRFSYYDIV